MLKSLSVSKVMHLLLITKLYNSSWVKRLFQDGFHDWKIIPLFLKGTLSGKNFRFCNNIDINNDILLNKIFILLSRYFHKKDK